MSTLAITSPSGSDPFQVEHGLSAAPTSVLITMTSGGLIWLDATLPYDDIYIYLHASDAGLTAILSINLALAPAPTVQVSSAAGFMPAVHKNPSEQFAVSLDFSADIGAGNSIASIISVTAISNQTGADASALVIAASPVPAIVDGAGTLTAVALTVMGGVAGQTYTIAILIVSTIGEQYQGQITLQVISGVTRYTTVDACAAAFPTFTRNGPKGPSDDLIQVYINDEGGKINAILQRRFQEAIAATPGNGSFAAWIAAFTTDQLAVLEKLNRFAACGEMGKVFAATGVTMFAKLADKYELEAQQLFYDLDGRDEKGAVKKDGGVYDKLFDPGAQSISPRAVLQGFRDGAPRRDIDIEGLVGWRGEWED